MKTDRPSPAEGPDEGSPQGVSSASEREALLAAMMDEARELEKIREERARERGPGPTRYLILVLVAAASVWVWFGSPPWLVPDAPAPPPVAEEESALRLTMYIQAQQLEAFREEENDLPPSLTEIASPLPHLSYRAFPDGSYEILGRTDRVFLVYSSWQPLREFAANGDRALHRGPSP